MVNIVALPLLILIGLVMLGGLAAIIVLLSNPKTRMAGIVLLAIALLLAIGGGTLLAMLVFWGGSGASPFVYTLF